MQDLLDSLVHLDAAALHARAEKAVERCASASWELAGCLVAMEKSGGFRVFDCATVIEYAERRLGLGALKALELLRGGRALERFPMLGQACRDGSLCWSKLREIARVVDAATEEAWLAYAVGHNTREIERAVAVSPQQFRQERAVSPTDAQRGGSAATPSTAKSGTGTAARVDEQPGVAAAPDAGPQTAVACSAAPLFPVTAGVLPGAQLPVGPGKANRTPPPVPHPPRLVRVELYLTPDQFAVVDEAMDRLRSQAGRHVSKEVAVERLARHYLAGGASRTRANHPVVVRVDSANGTAFYETSRGTMPASAAALDDALARERGVFVPLPDGENIAPLAPQELRAEPVLPQTQNSDSPEGVADEHGCAPAQATAGRKPIRPALQRATLERAQYRCERCGATIRLEVDHVRAVCDKGTDDGNLRIVCHDCHQHKHAADFADDPRYIRGRAAGLARRKRRGEQPAPDG